MSYEGSQCSEEGLLGLSGLSSGLISLFVVEASPTTLQSGLSVIYSAHLYFHLMDRRLSGALVVIRMGWLVGTLGTEGDLIKPQKLSKVKLGPIC